MQSTNGQRKLRFGNWLIKIRSSGKIMAKDVIKNENVSG